MTPVKLLRYELSDSVLVAKKVMAMTLSLSHLVNHPFNYHVQHNIHDKIHQ